MAMREFMNIVEGRSAFADWFGDSRVVDEAGKPLVVYHGTNQTFKRFSKVRGGMATGPQAGAAKGFFFTNSRDKAQAYAEGAGRKVIANTAQHDKESARLQKESERLERIASRTQRESDWQAYYKAYEAWESFETDAVQNDQEQHNQVISAYLSLQNPLEVNFNGTLQSEEGVIEEVVSKAIADGRDGVIMRNIYDSPLGGFTSDHYVAFRSNQIRRA